MEDAKETLFKFFDEMNEWNRESYQYIQENTHEHETSIDFKEILLSTLEPIVRKFCTKKIIDQIIAPTCSKIPEYDENYLILERTEEMTKNKIAFYIQELNRAKSLFRYTLIRKNGVWLIDRKDRFDEFDNKWGKSYI